MSDKMNLADKLALFLTERRAVVIATLAVVVVIIVAAAVWSPVKQNLADKAAETAEDLDNQFSTWIYADEDSKDEEETVLIGMIDDVLSKGSSYASQRALFIRGQLYITKEMWTEASADYAMLAEEYPKSYLAPTALFNAASTLEEAGDSKGAAGFYLKLSESYGDTAPEAGEALFNLGRLAEEEGDNEKAIAYYEQLITDYPNSEWKNIAKTRILLKD